MDKFVVDIQQVYVTLHNKSYAEVGVQTDLGSCCALLHSELCALLDYGQAN